MKNLRIAFVLVSLLISILAAAGSPEWSARGTLRTHAQVTLTPDQILTLSLLDRSRGQRLNGTGFHSEQILLVEGPTLGRWILEIQEEGSGEGRISHQSVLRRPQGAEALRVEYTALGKEGSGSFQIYLPGRRLDVAEAEIRPSYASGLAPQWKDLPVDLQEILGVLRQLASDGDHLWGPGPLLLAPFFGIGDPRDAKFSLATESLPVDCAFDASFGFPCDPNEEPRVGGKAYVKPIR